MIIFLVKLAVFGLAAIKEEMQPIIYEFAELTFASKVITW